jgi:hypothetical protein
MKQYLDFAACGKRWPRLIRCMQWVAILSQSEAACGIRDYRTGRDNPRIRDLLYSGGGEAVSHFGGPREVIQRAILYRNILRRKVAAGNIYQLP